MLPVASLTATVLFVALELAARKSLPTLSVAALDASPVKFVAYTFDHPKLALPNVNVLSTAGSIPSDVNVAICVSTPAPVVTLNLISPLLVTFCITPSYPFVAILNWKSFESPTSMPVSGVSTAFVNTVLPAPACTKFAAATPPSLSAFVAVPWNLSVVLVTPEVASLVFLNVIPLLILS